MRIKEQNEIGTISYGGVTVIIKHSVEQYESSDQTCKHPAGKRRHVFNLRLPYPQYTRQNQATETSETDILTFTAGLIDALPVNNI